MPIQLFIDFDSAERLRSSSKYDDFKSLCEMMARIPHVVVNNRIYHE